MWRFPRLVPYTNPCPMPGSQRAEFTLNSMRVPLSAFNGCMISFTCWKPLNITLIHKHQVITTIKTQKYWAKIFSYLLIPYCIVYQKIFGLTAHALFRKQQLKTWWDCMVSKLDLMPIAFSYQVESFVSPNIAETKFDDGRKEGYGISDIIHWDDLTFIDSSPALTWTNL